MAIRSFPLQKAMETVQMTINNQSMSVNIGDILSALEHFNISDKLRQVDFSKCATYPCCQFQNFFDSYNETANSAALPSANNTGLPQYYRQIKSELCLWSESPLGSVQKQMPFVVTNNQIVASNAIATASVIQFVSTEPLFLSPLYWGDCEHDDAAFYGVNNMSFTFNFQSNAGNRMLAIDALAANLASTDTEAGARALAITTSVSFNATLNSKLTNVGSYEAALLFQYITPQLVDRGQSMNKVLNYPYFNIERWPGSSQQSPTTLATATFTSNNVQLSSIPSKVYIFVRPTNASLQANPCIPDCFARIEKVNIQWGNRSGLLASASIQQLYDISVRAGCCLSYNDWAAVPMAKNLTSSTFGGTHVYGTGSVLAIDPIDLGLDSIDAPGKLQKTSLYVSCDIRNMGAATQAMELYVVAVSQGIFTLFNGQASSLIGVLNSNDVLNAHEQTAGRMVSYADARRMYGGNFLSDIKADLQGLLKKKKAPMGLGSSGAGQGAGVSGAARMTRMSLKDRLS